MEEFEKLLAESFQSDAIPGEAAPAEESLSLPLTPGDDSSVEDDSSGTESAPEIAGGAEPELATPELTEEEGIETPASTKPE
jgi:hypothetical protein